VLSTLGVILLIAAFPLPLIPGCACRVLAAGGEALLLIGVWTKEVVFVGSACWQRCWSQAR